MSLIRHRDVVSSPAGRTTATTRHRKISPGQVLGGVLGIVLVLFGIVAVTRSGIDSSLNTPPTDLLGLTHSSIVGLVEIGAGLLMVLGSVDRAARGLLGGVGALLLLGGVVVAAAGNELLLDLGTRHSTGWFLVVMGALGILAAAMPSFVESERVVVDEPVGTSPL